MRPGLLDSGSPGGREKERKNELFGYLLSLVGRVSSSHRYSGSLHDINFFIPHQTLSPTNLQYIHSVNICPVGAAPIPVPAPVLAMAMPPPYTTLGDIKALGGILQSIKELVPHHLQRGIGRYHQLVEARVCSRKCLVH